MDFTGWIKIFALAIQLFNQAEMDKHTYVVTRWESLDRLSFRRNTNAQALVIEIRLSDRSLLTSYVLVPWMDLSEPVTSHTDVAPLTEPKNLITVNEFVLVYRTYLKPGMTDKEKRLLDKIHDFIQNLFDEKGNNQIVNQTNRISTKEGLQIISMKEYRNYVYQEVALSGTKRFNLSENNSEIKNKMILRLLYPDIGMVKSQWLFSGYPMVDDCFKTKEKEIMTLFNEAIQKCIDKPNLDRWEVCNQTAEAYEKLLNSCKTQNKPDQNFGIDLLKRLFYIERYKPGDVSTNLTGGQVQPKLTPDLATDYMPSIQEALNKIPKADILFICELINQFVKYQKLARENPGSWVDGNMAFGARPKEYEPTQDELILSEIGEKIREVVLKNKKEDITARIQNKPCAVKKINYKRFTFTHTDVPGYGRFFYVDRIEEVSLKLF